MKRIILVLAALLFLTLGQVQAATDVTFNFVGVHSVDGTCAGGVVTVNAGYSATALDWSVFDTTLIVITDGYGTLIDSYTVFASDGRSVLGTYGLGFGVNAQTDVVAFAYTNIAARPIVVTFYDLQEDPRGVEPDPLYEMAKDDPVLAQFNYDPAAAIPDCETLPLLIQDAPKLAEAQIMVAPMPEGEDLMGLDVWGVTPEGEGYKAFYITGEEFNSLPDEPTEAVLIQQTEEGVYPAISFYKLPTGEYQFNIGPYQNGDVQVVIFSGVPPTEVYRQDYNIYDPVP